MSTGIVSISFFELGVLIVARSLAVFNIACYALLLALFTVRTAAFPKRTLADLRNRDRHWGTLTFIVATNTVGVQFLLFFDTVAVAAAMGVTIVATPLLLYYPVCDRDYRCGKGGCERADRRRLLARDRLHAVARGPRRVARRTIGGYGNAVVLLSMSYFGSGGTSSTLSLSLSSPTDSSTARSVPTTGQGRTGSRWARRPSRRSRGQRSDRGWKRFRDGNRMHR